MRMGSILGGRGSVVTCGWLAFSGLLWLASACLVQWGLANEYRDLTNKRRDICVACGRDVITQWGRLECELFGLKIYREGQLAYLFEPVNINYVYAPPRKVIVRAGASDCAHEDTELAACPFGSLRSDDLPPRIVRWFTCSLLLAVAALLSWACACVVPCCRFLRKRRSKVRKPVRRWWLVNAACAGVAVVSFAAAPGPLLGGVLSHHLRRTEAAAQAVGNGNQISTKKIDQLLYEDVPVSTLHDRMMLGYRRQSLALALARSKRPSDNQLAARYLYGDTAEPDAVTPELLNTLYGRLVDGVLGLRVGRFRPSTSLPALSPEEAAGIVSMQTNSFGEIAVEWHWGECFSQFVRKRVGEAEIMLPYYHVMYARNRRPGERVRRYVEERVNTPSNGVAE